MDLSKTNKTLIICLIFILGIASVLLDFTCWYMMTVFLLSIFLFLTKKVSLRFIAVCYLVVFFGLFYSNFRKPVPDYLYNIAPTKAAMRGRVISLPEINGLKTRFRFEVFSINEGNSQWKRIKAKSQVTAFNDKEAEKAQIGDIVELTGNVRIPYKATNFGQFDYQKYLRNSRIFTLTYVSKNHFRIIKHPKSGKWFLIQKLTNVKNKIISIHKQNLESPRLEILGGAVFGDYAVPAPKDIKQDFINSGLLHLLAASGMNVAFIFGLWFFLARKLKYKLPYKISIIIGAFLVAVYAVLTGLPPSVTRATWMLEFILLGKLIDRSADNVALLALVCSVMLLIDPYIITDIGFQLSFLVTFGLLVCSSIFIDKAKPVPEVISAAIFIPVIAQLWAAPIQVYHFNNFAVYSILANILVMPFMFFITSLGFIGSISAQIPLIGKNSCWLLDKCAEPFINLLLYISGYVSDLPGALQYFPTPELLWIILFYVLILILTLQLKQDFSKKWFNVIIVSLIVVFSLVAIRGSFSRELNLTFFDVGEADSVYIQTPERKNILVDTADVGKNGYNSAKTIIIPYLRDIGVSEIDHLVITHPDKDHIGGTLELLKSFKINQIIDNGEAGKSRIYKRIADFIDQNKLPKQSILDSQKVSFDNSLQVQAIRPQNTNNKSNNGESIILYIKYKDFSALLMGDAEADSLDLLKKFVKKPVNLVKIGHHGSFRSVNDEFINYLKPEIAVISVGENEYNHPNNKIIDILNRHKVKIYRTDENGAIKVSTEGKKLVINAFLEN